MPLISLPYSRSGLVVIDIPVFLTERKAALRQHKNVHRYVLFVGSKVHTERHSIAKIGILQLQIMKRLYIGSRLYFV